MIVCTYILFSFHASSGGGVVHSYGRLIYHERVITDKHQLQPLNNDNGDGRILCTVNSGEAGFTYITSTDTTQDIHQMKSGTKATAVIRVSAFNNFVNFEGRCGGSYHYLFLSRGENITEYI